MSTATEPESEKSAHWRFVEVDAKDLAGHTFESLTASYRGNKPVALFTDLAHLQGYTVLNVFAPLHAAFWAAGAYAGCWRLCGDSLGELNGNADARDHFMKDLRAAKVRKNDPQIRLFDAFA